ncbi:MAG: carbohydrate binding family 9 domain-containing protein [Candidatus Aminicenantes bacterium]|nr:carbohydrate binding family 9 domain-containing protein [Candidatus Aminicenantes bacterium]
MSRKRLRIVRAGTLFAAAVIALFVLSSGLPGQSVPKQARAVKIDRPILVDGRLDEPEWAAAPDLTDFVQYQPERGAPASVRTIAKILLEKDRIYFGFLCYDPEPAKVIARLTKRDSDLTADDSVGIVLDTFADRRNGYLFLTNLLGTQQDGRTVDDGLTQDTTWDGTWTSAAVRTDFGWSAEIAIELSSLKFVPGKDMTWGLNIGRCFPRVLEFSFWPGFLESPYKVSQYGILLGLDLEASKKQYQVIPHVLSKLEEGKAAEFEAGLDARYAFSQAVSANLTVNPDFATVEADQEQINLTRFELNLQEKRNFFLEGSEIYNQRINLFYSRRIGDIYGGVKLYGKSGGYEFSGLSAQTKSVEANGEESANFTVFRLKNDVMSSSSLGFLAANKLVGGRNKGTAGFDTSLNFTDNFKFTGQLALSYGDRNRDNLAFFLRPAYETSTFHIHLRYSQLGANFGDNANAVGFVSDDNRRELDSALEKTFFIKKGGLERIAYESNYNISWGMNGVLRSWQVDQGLNVDLRNKFSIEVQHSEEYKLYEKEFRNRQTELNLGYNTREWQSAEIAWSFGRNYDLDFHLVEGRLNYKLTPEFSLEYGLTRLILDPDPEKESTWIHVFRATNYFGKDLFLKVFYQVHTAIDKRNVQVLFVYRFQPPFGLVQIAYQKGTARFGERGRQGHTLFFKVAFVF